MKRSLLDDMNTCTRILIDAEGEDVTIGDLTLRGAVSDESSDLSFADGGGASAGSSLRIVVAERANLSYLVGQAAIVRGMTYYITGCAYSGADNEFTLIATSDP